MAEHKPHLSSFKKKEVEETLNLLNAHPVIAVVCLSTLPTKMLQKIRKALADKVIFKITKKSYITLALEQCQKKNIQQLASNFEGNIALLFTKEDPFMLYKIIDKNRTTAPIKAGQKAPTDLSIQEGATPFTPGPMIGELGVLGLKTEVKEGKIHIKTGKVVAKQGEVVNQKTAEVLTKLGVEPMRLGLNVVAVYENGEVIQGSVLAINEEEYIQKIMHAHAEALALAMGAGIIIQETVEPLVKKAYRQAKAVLDASGVVSPDNLKEKLSEAERAASAIQGQVPQNS